MSQIDSALTGKGKKAMDNQNNGIEPYLSVVWGDPYWVCGYCQEPIRLIRDTVTSGKNYCPNYCPHCGVKVKKD